MDELIKALRICGNFAERDGCDEKCPYFNDRDCPKRIMADAANVIETLIVELEQEKYHVRLLEEVKGSLITDNNGLRKKSIDLAKKLPKWINVEDRLPEDRDEYGQGVDVIATDGIVTTRAFYGYPGGHDEWFINAGEQWEATFGRPVTHWMKLPKLPQADTRKGEEK